MPSADFHRAAPSNPTPRFDSISLAEDPDALADLPENPADAPLPRTQFFRDDSQSILSKNDSPDVGFDTSVNPYRGCEHGCIYCYARPTHEYLGLSAGLDFESKIFIKREAPRLLREALASPKYQPRPIFLSGVTDAYQIVERRERLTRACLEVLADCRNPVSIITKNALVARDADLLARLAEHRACAVALSITTLDDDLRALMEPRASPPQARLDAVTALAKAGVPVGVMIAPIIPGLNDHEVPKLIEAAAAAGAQFACFTVVRLPYGVKDLFADWLGQNFPLKKEAVLAKIRSVRGGQLNRSEFHDRMKGEGIIAEQITGLFHIWRKRCGLERDFPALSVASFQRPNLDGAQMNLF